MQPPRFWYDPANRLLVLDTVAPLTGAQRRAAALFARPIFAQRHRNMPPGPRRDAVAEVVKKLDALDFVERPIPDNLSQERVLQ